MAVCLNLSWQPFAVAELLQAVQYADDSVEGWFRDGSRMLLAGCGSAFTHWSPVSQDDAGEVNREVYQYTQFAVSEYREKVAALVNFRNQFAERPFVCKTIATSASVQKSHTPVRYASWPDSLHRPEGRCYLTTTSGGCLQLQATDGHASVQLSPHAQSVVIHYLASIPLPSGSSERPPEEETVTQNHYSVVMSEVHSVLAVPEHWKHPVSLLLQEGNSGPQGKQEGADESDSNKENELGPPLVSTPLPSPLPLSCPNLHLHQSRSVGDADPHKLVKAMYSEQVLYRVYAESQPVFVEAMPTGDTLLRSRDLSGRFFSCWTVAERGGKVMEHVYSCDHPPPSSAHARGYSLTRVMGTARRLLNSTGNQEHVHCWKISSPSPSLPPHQLHTTHVPGLGRFMAYSSGHIRVVFTDRTSLDLLHPSTPSQEGMVTSGGLMLERGVCRVMLPNGRYQMVSTSHPMQLARYVKVALDWCDWLSTPPQQREPFYQGTVFDDNSTRKVLAEVEKNRQFESLWASETPDGEGCAQQALRRTTEALRDINTLLEK